MKQQVNRYIKHLATQGRLSPYTIRNYEADLKGFVEYAGSREVESPDGVDRLMLRGYLAWLAAQEIARGSIARKVSTIRSFFRWLVQEKELGINPLTNFIPPKRGRRLPTFLHLTEIAHLLQAPDPAKPQGLRDRALLEMLYAAGLRVSEVVGIDLDDLDLDRNEVKVWGKGAKQRMVLLGQPAADALRTYIVDARPSLLRGQPDPALFINRLGGRLSERAVQISIKKYATKAGIDQRLHPHLLRHTFATHLLDGGADLRVVQELLGHDSLGSTQIYTHVSQAEMRRHYLSAHPRGRMKPESK